MQCILRTAAVVVIVGLTAGWAWAAQGRSLEVVVTYQGGGEVSSASPIMVSLFDSQTFDVELVLEVQVVSENGGTASFSNLTGVCGGALYRAGWGGWV